MNENVARTVKPPLVSADMIDPANYPRGRFDEDLGIFVKEQARLRSPTEGTNWRHAVGFAGELVAGAYFNTRADWSVHSDYVGDDGYDLKFDGYRIEVKTVSRYDDLQLRVPIEQQHQSDYFVLARSTEPTEGAELIGYISDWKLSQFSHQFQSDDFVRLDTKYLDTFQPIFLPPKKIRRVHSKK